MLKVTLQGCVRPAGSQFGKSNIHCAYIFRNRHRIVIKYNANQKYCTDGISTAIFKELCREADVPYQTFVNRSDIAGGSTLGNISNTQAAINTVDIGLPQLAMHSAYETAGVKDTESLIRAAKVFYR